jgi:anti-sigma factor RsiW
MVSIAHSKKRGIKKMRLQCRSIQHYLSDYIDYGLSERQNVIVKNHLRRCLACQQELESLRRTTGLLSFYIEPEPPAGYHDRFWRELELTIEQREPRPMWCGGIALWRSVSGMGQDLLDQLANSCRALIDAPSQWLLRWGRLVPIYSFIFIIMSSIFVATQLMQSPEESKRAGANQIRSPLDDHPIRMVRAQESRELVTKREKVLGLPQELSGQQHHTPQKVSHQLEIMELPDQDWDSYGRTPVARNGEVPGGHPDDSDVFPDLIAFAQLSAPDSALTTREFSGAVGINSPFPEKFEREGRQSNSSLRVLKDVAVRDLSLTEIYDSVKL